MDEAEHCHRVAMMQSGSIVCAGSPQELRETQIQGQVYTYECDPLFPALAAALTIQGISDASVLGSRLHVLSPPNGPTMESVSQELFASGIIVHSAEPGEVTLEDVFVAMAGEAS